MYAVIRTGGKQYRVEHGAQLEVEHLDADEGSEVDLRPLLVVDGETVLATPSQLGDASVKVKVIGATRGPKINGFTYKSKSNNRRRWGHRQGYALIEVVGIEAAGKRSEPSRPEPAEAAAEKPAKETAARKSATKKSSTKKSSTKKSPTKKSPTKKSTTTPTSKKTTAKKTAAKKAAAKKSTAKTTKKKSTRKKDES